MITNLLPRADPPVIRPTQRDYLSFSAISSFASCPLRYYFRYIAGLPEETVAASLAFGSAFHAGLEHHFRELLAGNKAPGLDEMLGAFSESWNANTEGRLIQFGKNDDQSTLGNLAERMFLAFQMSEIARPAGSIIGIEEELRGELIPGLPDLLARVDLIVDDGNSLIVTDFKTARSSWSEDHAEDSAGQLLLYHELVKSLAGGKAIRLGFGVVSKAKAPKVELHQVQVDKQRIERTRRIVERVWNAINGGNYYPNPSPLNCATCPYQKPCREWTR